MCNAINKYFQTTGTKIGIKPAGGISNVNEAIRYYNLVKTMLGESWLTRDLFRIGASSLVKDIVQNYAHILL